MARANDFVREELCLIPPATCVFDFLLVVSAFCRNALFQSIAAGVAQLVEHLICNQRVGGSSPFAGSTAKQSVAGVVEWLMAPGCKPGGLTPYVGSNPTPCTGTSGCSSVGRASAFQAEGREFESRRPLQFFGSCSSRARVAQG